MRLSRVTRPPILALLLGCAFPSLVKAGVDFARCRARVEDLLPRNDNGTFENNATLDVPGFGDPIYHGSIYGFHPDREARPLTLTYEGCKHMCGSSSEVYSVDSAFEILTTWVLPLIALLSSFPYESNNIRKNLEAFANWVGSPAAALTTTIWNLLMIRRCQRLAERDMSNFGVARESLFVLSCINQYQYERRGYDAKKVRRMSTIDVDRPRDKALLRGVLFPFLDHPSLQPGKPLRLKLENVTTHLAFQLRLQRRRGVFPLTLSIVWFLLAFVVSVVTAFAQLGDNTTAHSLALGLLLSWLPIIVVATIVDRNPVSATRCGILIERWLYTVDTLFEQAGLDDQEAGRANSFVRSGSKEGLLPPVNLAHRSSFSIQRRPLPNNAQYDSIPVQDFDDPGEGSSVLLSPISPQTSKAYSIRSQKTDTDRVSYNPIPRPSPQPPQWRQDSDMLPFMIQDYVGQGRRLRYCAVTDTVLDLFESGKFNLVLPGDDDAHEFKRRLVKRPFGWYLTWFISQFLVTMSFTMAFLVSFNTPTIGLGCRSLSYLVWWSFSLVSWVVILIKQEPPRLIRQLAWITDVVAICALFTVMGFQLTGGLNTCMCKSSTFGSSKYGGYMDFENGEFYHKAYDVRQIWGIATGLGLVSCSGAIAWLYHRWSRDSMLWKFKEDERPEIVEGVDLHWLT